MKHLLFDPGMLPIKELVSDLKYFSKENKLILITEKRRQQDYEKNCDFCEIRHYEDLKNVSNESLGENIQKKYSDIVRSVLNDHRTLLIAERVNRLLHWSSIFNNVQLIEKIVYNSLLLFQKNKIDTLLFQATPHNLPNWVMAKVAEEMGIKVLMIQTSPLPWRYWIVEGLDVQRPIFPTTTELTDFDEKLLQDYIKLNSEDYQTALPSYEKKRIESRKGKYWSWRKELKDGIKHPKKLISLSIKRKLFKLYDSLAIQPDLNKKHLVFFLHYQPERTSMPEGLNFSNQWLIIKMISNALPAGWRLLVKEHQSVYTNHFDFRYRNSIFYTDISALKNVDLIPLDYNTFDLIDASEAIVTITGTVGVQTLIRGKAVFVFGVASYRDFKNVYFIDNYQDLENSLLQIGTRIERDNIKDDLFNVMNSTIGGNSSNPNEIVNFYNSTFRVNGHLRLIRSFLNN